MKQVLTNKTTNYSTFNTGIKPPLFLNQMIHPNTTTTALLAGGELVGCHRHHQSLPDKIQISRYCVPGLIQLTTIPSFHSQTLCFSAEEPVLSAC